MIRCFNFQNIGRNHFPIQMGVRLVPRIGSWSHANNSSLFINLELALSISTFDSISDSTIVTRIIVKGSDRNNLKMGCFWLFLIFFWAKKCRHPFVLPIPWVFKPCLCKCKKCWQTYNLTYTTFIFYRWLKIKTTNSIRLEATFLVASCIPLSSN